MVQNLPGGCYPLWMEAFLQNFTLNFLHWTFTLNFLQGARLKLWSQDRRPDGVIHCVHANKLANGRRIRFSAVRPTTSPTTESEFGFKTESFEKNPMRMTFTRQSRPHIRHAEPPNWWPTARLGYTCKLFFSSKSSTAFLSETRTLSVWIQGPNHAFAGFLGALSLCL